MATPITANKALGGGGAPLLPDDVALVGGMVGMGVGAGVGACVGWSLHESVLGQSVQSHAFDWSSWQTPLCGHAP